MYRTLRHSAVSILAFCSAAAFTSSTRAVTPFEEARTEIETTCVAPDGGKNLEELETTYNACSKVFTKIRIHGIAGDEALAALASTTAARVSQLAAIIGEKKRAAGASYTDTQSYYHVACPGLRAAAIADPPNSDSYKAFIRLNTDLVRRDGFGCDAVIAQMENRQIQQRIHDKNSPSTGLEL